MDGLRPGVSGLRFCTLRHAGTASSALFVTAGRCSGTEPRNGRSCARQRVGFARSDVTSREVRVTAASVVNEASRLGTSERMSAMADRHHVRIEYCVPLRGTPQRRRSGGADSRGVGRQPQCGGGGDRSRRIFDVHVDGDLVFTKSMLGRYPDPDDVVPLVRESSPPKRGPSAPAPSPRASDRKPTLHVGFLPEAAGRPQGVSRKKLPRSERPLCASQRAV